MNAILTERNWRLLNTCSACPEQYSILDPEGQEVGYIRLRSGYLQVQCPEPGGEIVYDHLWTGDPLKGCFEGREYEEHMPKIFEAVAKWWEEHNGETQET